MSLPSSRRTAIWFGCIVALAAALDAWFYSGFFASDDTEYLHGAIALFGENPDGSAFWIRPRLGNSRIAMTIPSGFIYWLSGGSVAAVAWFHVVYHLGLVAIAFVLGRLIADARVGLLAGLLVASSPLYYVFAGAVLPDNATAFWLGLSMILLEVMRRRAQVGLSVKVALVGYGAAGLALGAAYACKETALIMAVPAAVWVMAAAPRLRDLVWIRDGAFLAGGLVLFVAIELVALRLIMDTWVWRLGIVEGSGDLLVARMAEQGSAPLERFAMAYERLEAYIPLTLWLLVLGAVGHGLTRVRHIGLLAYFWWPAIYLTIGSTSFTAYRPPSLQARYYSLVVLPAGIMLASLVVVLLDRWAGWRRISSWPGVGVWGRGPAVVIGLVLTLVIVSESQHNASRAGNLYRATMARSFTAAYEHARTRYPEHPIVLSQYYQRRMTLLLFPKPPDDVYLDFSPSPEPPFLYIGRASESLEEQVAGYLGDFEVRSVAEIFPPATRGVALRHGLSQMLQTAPLAAPDETQRHGAVILLVSARGPGSSLE